MKRTLMALFFLLAMLGGQVGASPLNSPGDIFIREKASGAKAFKTELLAQAQILKTQGFTAYSLHKDLKAKDTFILTLKCSDLGKGVSYIRSEAFMSAMDKAGARIPQIWYGLDTQERVYTSQPKMTGGIVIARNEVRDYDFWLKCFRAQNHNHEGRKYKNSGYSIHHLPGDPAVAIVVHEASDVSKAPQFMTSDHLNGEMESTGVVGLEIWYGVNIEEGTF